MSLVSLMEPVISRCGSTIPQILRKTATSTPHILDISINSLLRAAMIAGMKQADSTTATTDHALRRKWGRALDYGGFQAVPNVLLARQHSLRLSSTDIVVLLHFNRYWWTPDRDPFPRPARIAEQMGVHRRTVERALQGLEKKGLVKRLRPQQISSGRVVQPISLTPLAASLGKIAETPARRVPRDGS